MRWIINILGILFILAGFVWILQGVNVLPGSFMSGHIQYAYLGIGVGVVGIVLLYLANRRRKAGISDHRPGM